MKLSELLEDNGTVMHSQSDLDIKGLTADSRSVQPGYLFAALPGTVSDGRTFIPEALSRGATTILSLDGTTLDHDTIPVITDANPRRRFSLMAAKYFAAQPATIAAVTGTNGKTSVAHFLRQIWAYGSFNAAAMGTLGIISDAVHEAGNLTTPDPVTLHQQLARLHDSGVDHLVMEASSHGLDQFRLDGVKVKAAGFTNLSRDHLDYHGSMVTYFNAKCRLFSDLLVDGGHAVINADTEKCADLIRLCEQKGHAVLTFGRNGEALKLLTAQPVSEGQSVSLSIEGKTEQLIFPLAGDFQVMNALCAAGLAMATGMNTSAVVDSLQQLEGVSGRLEYIGRRNNGASVYVDYAHTPSALATVINALKPHTKGQLAVVFGAGGDRDAGKRKLMGQAATAADVIYVTDDNPRTEDPAAIRAEVLKGCPESQEFADRAEAITAAVADLDSDDVLLVAGKGHETGQIIGTEVLPFDDRDVSRTAIQQANAKS